MKNYCPYWVEDIYITTSPENPSSRWLGTTWEKIEGKFLLGSSSAYALESTGGTTTITLTKSNLPAEKLQVEKFSLSNSNHKHTGGFPRASGFGYANGRYGTTTDGTGGVSEVAGRNFGLVYAYTSSEGGTNTGTASPYTNVMGAGTPIHILPPYFAVNIWKRLS